MGEIRKRCLILFTEFYSFSDYHAYLNEEVYWLSKAFDQLIIVSRDTKHPQKFSMPVNAVLYRTNASQNLKFYRAIKIFFQSRFYRELKNIGNNKYCKINVGVLKILVASLLAVSKYEKLLKRIYHQNNLQSANLFIYSWWMNDYVLAFGAIKKIHHDVKLYSRTHSSDLYFFRHPYNYLPLKKQIIELLGCVFAISDHGKNYLISHHHLNELQAEKVFVRRLGTKNKAPIKTEPNATFFIVVSNSFITPLKRVELIANALLLVENLVIHWIHFGDSSGDENGFKVFKQKIQNKLNQKKNIKVEFKGYVENEKILNYYETDYVDAFINVSEFEGTAVSIMEAMSFGIPIVATDVGATNELVSEENGILLPESVTPELLAQVIKNLFSISEAEKNLMRSASRKKWEENFNAEVNYPSLINEFFR